MFKLKLHPWQKKVLQSLSKPKTRIALKAANGSGKTAMCAAPAALWHALLYPNSVCVTTSGVYRQVKEQMWPTIRSLARKVGGLGIQINQTELSTPNGSRVIGFSTDDPGRFEGWHADNLLMIIDEAKTVKDEIFMALERCQPNRVLLMSSPGGCKGQFYRCFSKEQDFWDLHTVTAYDCPHIEPEWIEQQIEKWGASHPLIASMIRAEFMEESGESTVIPWDSLMHCLENPPKKQKGEVVAAVDFAAGSDENVLCIRNGNHITKLLSWRDKNTMAACGRFALEFERAGLKPQQIFCDAGGLGLPMAQQLAEMGWPMHQINLGSRAHEPDRFANRSAEMWFNAARQIEKADIVVPDDEILHAQLTNRRVATTKTGKLNLESKAECRARGFSSPDRADAFVMAASYTSEFLMQEGPRQATLEDIFEEGLLELSGENQLINSMGINTG